MDLRKIDDVLTVSPQIAPGDMAALKRAGFRSIICNRPDGEEPGQPGFADIAGAAARAGLAARHVPIRPGPPEEADVAAFGIALRELPAPILAYCRSGTRSATLWSLSVAGTRPTEEILAATRAAGYDMAPLADRIARA